MHEKFKGSKVARLELVCALQSLASSTFLFNYDLIQLFIFSKLSIFSIFTNLFSHKHSYLQYRPVTI